jgi:hypothetical protein
MVVKSERQFLKRPPLIGSLRWANPSGSGRIFAHGLGTAGFYKKIFRVNRNVVLELWHMGQRYERLMEPGMVVARAVLGDMAKPVAADELWTLIGFPPVWAALP